MKEKRPKLNIIYRGKKKKKIMEIYEYFKKIEIQ